MNEAAREALVKHALLGTPKADGIREDNGSYCGLGIIGLELMGDPWFSTAKASAQGILDLEVRNCPIEDCKFTGEESWIIAHLNNKTGHDLDFLTIARKV